MLLQTNANEELSAAFLRCLFPLMKLLFLEMLVGSGKVTEKQNTTIYLTESCLNRVAVNLKFAGNFFNQSQKGWVHNLFLYVVLKKKII